MVSKDKDWIGLEAMLIASSCVGVRNVDCGSGSDEARD